MSYKNLLKIGGYYIYKGIHKKPLVKITDYSYDASNNLYNYWWKGVHRNIYGSGSCGDPNTILENFIKITDEYNEEMLDILYS